MQRFGLKQPLPTHAKGSSLAMGKFDGVHRAHLAVIAAARDAAARLNAPLSAPTFEPHPRRRFEPNAPPFMLQTTAQRERALAAAGVTILFEFSLDEGFLNLSDRAFDEEVLAHTLGIRHISVGADFRYGRGRMGDVHSLQRDGAEFGFGVTPLAPVLDDAGAQISSSAIRAALQRGDLPSATDMLGRPWAIEGVVERGFARGRDFGFPTLNLSLGDYLTPLLGVYAVRVDLGGDKRVGVASIGVNPTVGALPRPILEAHLFDFDGDLYGRQVEVEIIAFLRPEAKFDSIEALKAQMARDAAQARALLA